MHISIQLLVTIAVIFITAFCAVTDLRSGRIYNKVTYSGALVAVILNSFAGVTGLTLSLTGLFGAFALFLLLHKFGVLAAGDVKLLAVIGAFKGFPFVIYSSVYILCFASVLGLATLIWKGRLFPSLKWMGGSLVSFVIPRVQKPLLEGGMTTMPFAPAIFLGTVYALWLEYAGGAFGF